jgi:hypothetical protein
MKTKHGILLGIAALLAAMVLLACGGGGGGPSGPKVNPPDPGAIPTLPSGSTPVTVSDTAWIADVLEDIEDFYDDLGDAVQEEVFKDGEPEKSPYNYQDDINLAGSQGITSGTVTVTVHYEFNVNENTGSGSMSGTSKVAAKTNIVTSSGLTVLAGSTLSTAMSMSQNNNGYNQTLSEAYGLTVVSGGKTAKVVGSETHTGNENSSGWSYTEKGNVTVYGANDEKVFEDSYSDSDSGKWDDDEGWGVDGGEAAPPSGYSFRGSRRAGK